MKRLITIAEFPHPVDVKLHLLKELLEEAEIPYLVTNENVRAVKPMMAVISNLSIELKVYEENLQRALELMESIQ